MKSHCAGLAGPNHNVSKGHRRGTRGKRSERFGRGRGGQGSIELRIRPRKGDRDGRIARTGRLELDVKRSALPGSQSQWRRETGDREAGAQSLDRADGHGGRSAVRDRVRQRLAAADRDRPEVQATASQPDTADDAGRTSDQALASCQQRQAASNNQESDQTTKRSMTVHCDLGVPSPQTTAGFLATGTP